MNAAIDHVLDEVSKYSLGDKELIVDILKKRLVEEKREMIYKDYRQAMKDYRDGKVKSGSADDLFNALND
ncbi:MAG: hypothetical protein KAW12_14060 [Candidatus Aminicenantes bacterium]|nr:hypothetical protein [Candidatus Aminicenantes bacterium]